MPITYKKTVAVLKGTCSVEDAEPLLSWLINNTTAQVNLKHCDSPHTAVLQVLMALNPTVSVWPDDNADNRWLTPLLYKP